MFCCVSGALCLPGLPGCPCSKPVSPQASPQLSRSSSRFSNSSRRSASKGSYLSVPRGVDSTASPYECSCCCCNEDLIKIQVRALLSFVPPKPSLPVKLDSQTVHQLARCQARENSRGRVVTGLTPVSDWLGWWRHKFFLYPIVKHISL